MFLLYHAYVYLEFLILAYTIYILAPNPPEGMTSQDIRSMSEDDLLDMDYFLNDDELDDDFGEEGFYLF